MCSVYASRSGMLVVGWEWQCPEARPDELINSRETRTLEELVPSCFEAWERATCQRPRFVTGGGRHCSLDWPAQHFIHDPCSPSHSHACWLYGI